MNYEKKYKEALDRAQQAVDKGQVSQNFVDDIFPEHKERWHLLEEWLEEDGISAPMEAHQLERDKDGFLVGDVSDLSDYLPFLIHDAEDDTLEEVDADNLIDWSSDIDTKPKYDKIYSKK